MLADSASPVLAIAAFLRNHAIIPATVSEPSLIRQSQLAGCFEPFFALALCEPYHPTIMGQPWTASHRPTKAGPNRTKLF